MSDSAADAFPFVEKWWSLSDVPPLDSLYPPEADSVSAVHGVSLTSGASAAIVFIARRASSTSSLAATTDGLFVIAKPTSHSRLRPRKSTFETCGVSPKPFAATESCASRAFRIVEQPIATARATDTLITLTLICRYYTYFRVCMSRGPTPLFAGKSATCP